MKKLPIYNWRELIGYASSVQEAKKIVCQKINIPNGFTVDVWERPIEYQEILKLPAGYVYSTSYKY
jgi:hypothetical protein